MCSEGMRNLVSWLRQYDGVVEGRLSAREGEPNTERRPGTRIKVEK